MRIYRHSSSIEGSVLLATLGITTILGLGLASYLTLARQQHVSVARSQAWNAALAMAEAGVEEALAQMNPSLLVGTNVNRSANGWSLGADGMYHVTNRTLLDGYYDVAMTADLLPTIYATGYVKMPTASKPISRTVRVTTAHLGLFRAAMAARVNIDLKGNKIATDSFDSLDPNHSTNGLYDRAKRKANGDVATVDGLVNVQNADVKGTVYTGPEGSMSVGPGGSVGDLSWPLAGGVQEGHYKNDFNMDFPDVQAPYQTGLPPTGETINGTNYAWVLGNNKYMCTGTKDVKLGTGENVLVTGQATLYVTGDFLMSGSSSITIAPGGSLALYVGGAKTTITKVNNQGNCASFNYFGLPANKSLALTGNDLFLGTIYAPSVDLTLSGSGSPSTPFDFQGACAVNTIVLNGHFNFHFDENLKRAGPVSGFTISSWAEI